MMPEGITGQAIHELFIRHTALKALPWKQLGSISQNTYNDLADSLNAQYLAPLQGLVRDLEQTFITDSNIRGEKIAQLEHEIEQLRADFQRLKVMDGDIQREQDAEMAQLQRENDALKAVLTSCRVFVSHDAPVLKRNREEWDRERDELIRMATMLLKDEQKEG